MNKVTLTIHGEEYTAPVSNRANASLTEQLKAVMNAANEAYNDYCFAHKLGRYGN